MQIVEKIILSEEEMKAFDIVEQMLEDIQKETMSKSLSAELDYVLDFMCGFRHHNLEE